MRRLFPVPAGTETQQSSLSPLELVNFSDQNKLRLLQSSINESREALPKTKDVLARLNHFHPSMAKEFSLKDEAISQVSLQFLCESSGQHQRDSTTEIDSFIALSYCWHGVDWELAPGLSQPEMGWPISSRMVYGLLNQRVFSDEGVWIDGCCIDQDDESKKEAAIASMDLIYKSARMVVVIFEDIGISKNQEALLQNLFTNYNTDNWRTPSEHLAGLSEILLLILSARWFSGAWCAHELQFGADFVFLLPAGNGLVEFTKHWLEVLHSETRDYREQDEHLSKLLDDTFLSYDFLSRAVSRGTTERLSLMSEFSDIFKLDCSVQTDKIYISIHTSGLRLRFTRKKKSPNECQWILAMIALSTGDATVLGGVGDRLMVDGDSGTLSWLNWANDWRT